MHNIVVYFHSSRPFCAAICFESHITQTIFNWSHRPVAGIRCKMKNSILRSFNSSSSVERNSFYEFICKMYVIIDYKDRSCIISKRVASVHKLTRMYVFAVRKWHLPHKIKHICYIRRLTERKKKKKNWMNCEFTRTYSSWKWANPGQTHCLLREKNLL